MIPRKTVEEILDAAKIEEVVGDFVTLKRRGSNLIACCPFHNEKTPSFSVSPSKGIFKCFGCGKSGNAVGFVMEYSNLSYAEALKYLAKKYNIEVQEKEESAEEIAARQHSESLMLVCEFAKSFFQDQLKTPEGGIGYAYFRSRGLSDETIEKFGLGWAPKGRDSLFTAAKARGFNEEYLVDANLCVRSEYGKIYDRFYDRVTFPIQNINGRVVAFGARTLRNDKEIAKYLNSSETEIYVKRNTLYGMYQAKTEVHKKDKFILVEGYLDVISMHQAGICNVAASSGTSLTAEQVKLIKRFTENVTIIYDGDSAGIKAAVRGIGLVLEGGLNVKIVLLPDGDEPDSFCRKHSREEVESFIAEHERDFISFKTDLLLEEAGKDPIKRAGLINDIADTIALIPDPIKRSVYVQEAVGSLDVQEELLLRRIRKTREKALEEYRRRESQGARNTEAYPDEPMPAEESMGFDAEYTRIEENDKGIMAPSEHELLYFLLNHGRDELIFSEDSEYYNAEYTPTVAEFIDSTMYEDQAQFTDRTLMLTAEKYFSLYSEGLEQEKIISRLLDDPDEAVRKLALDTLTEKHQLTVKKFEASLTNSATVLTIFVPKALLSFNLARTNSEIAGLNRELKHCDDERADEIMARIVELNNLKKNINIKLGRV